MIMLDEARGQLRCFASLLSVTVLFLAGLAISATAAGQYPAKPIRVVITYSGGAEAINRLILQKVAESLGQPFILEAQTGANGSVGALAVARATADGYTLLSCRHSTRVSEEAKQPTSCGLRALRTRGSELRLFRDPIDVNKLVWK